MLPYPSYLRVYEPSQVLGIAPRGSVPLLDEASSTGAGSTVAGSTGAGSAVAGSDVASSDGADPEAGDRDTAERVEVTVASEQQAAMVATIRGLEPAFDATGPSGAYTLSRGGRDFVCPLDLSLRLWLSLSMLGDAVGDPAARVMVPAESRARADEAFDRWRRDHPTALPHIRQATWGVPRTWFLLVVEDERESYDAGGHPSVRYRALIGDARRRLRRAQSALAAVIEDLELHEELVDLGAWLDAFDDDSWVELDYAGVTTLLGSGLAQDRSARDVHTALLALRRGDFAAAGAAYRAFEARWRVVNAFERAN